MANTILRILDNMRVFLSENPVCICGGIFMKAEYERLKKDIAYHSHKYYVLDNPEITDSEYDKMMRRLLEIEKELKKRKSNAPALLFYCTNF